MADLTDGGTGVSRLRVLVFIFVLLGISRFTMHLPLPSPTYGFELYDLGHSLIPALDDVFGHTLAGWIWWTGAISLALGFTATLVAIAWRGVGCRLGVALAIATFLHSIFWHFTIMPIPHDLVWRFPLLTGESALPNDFWFSGHVALASMFAYAATGQPWRVRALAWLYVVLIALLVLSARAHYSIDVIGALFVSFAVYAASGRLLAARLFQRQR